MQLRLYCKSLLMAFYLLVILTGKEVNARPQAPTFNLSFKNARLETVLKAVEQQSEFRFIFSREAMALTVPVTLHLRQAGIEDVLRVVLQDQPLAYSRDDKFIILQLNEKPKPALSVEFRGKILDDSGRPIAGATITVKGTDRGAVSDSNGDFSLVVLQPGDVLIITSVEMETLEWTVKGRSSFIFRVKRKISDMDEAVVKGYYTTSRRLSTGSVSSLKAKQIEQQPVTNVLHAIQGRMSGVFISTQNGLPGGNITVQVRGRNSISAGNEPLYVVDGIPFISTPLNAGSSLLTTSLTGATNPLNSINPADIESIDILKDADATAIYGARGANGVVLIRTKRAASGKVKLDIDFSHGASRIAHLPQLLGPADYYAVRREAFSNDGKVPTTANAPDLLVWDTSKTTDWEEYLLGGTAPVMQVQANLGGGSEHTFFRLSGHYRKEGSILPADLSYQRYGAQIMFHHQSPGSRLSLDYTGIYSFDRNLQLSSSVTDLLFLPPDIPLYNPDNSIAWEGYSLSHPVTIFKGRSHASTENYLNNLQLAYRLSSSLSAKVSIGLSKLVLDQVMIYPSATFNPAFGMSAYSVFGNNSSRNLLAEPQLDFSRRWKDLEVNATVGSSWQHSIHQGNFVEASDFSNEFSMENPGAAGSTTTRANHSEYKYASLFARANLQCRQQYLLNLTMRRDGSTRFGPGKQYGSFGAAGAGWIFSSNKFVRRKLSALSFGKLRASYGSTGNDLIGEYQYLETYRNGTSYQNIIGLAPARVANPALAWETNRKLEVALDLGFLKNRVLLNVAWYNNRSDNQLLQYPLPYSASPFGTYRANYPALVQNSGWEFDMSAIAVKTPRWQWSVSGNLSFPKNELLRYPCLESSSFATSLVVGEDISIRKAYLYEGVDPSSGLPKYADVDKDGMVSGAGDFVIVGQSSPYYFGGFGSDLRYRQFELNLFFQFTRQFAQGSSPVSGLFRNTYKYANDRWRESGDVTLIPRPTTAAIGEYSLLTQSGASFYNASYLRFKNLYLAYNVDEQLLHRLHMQKLKVYLEAQNLFTWNKQGYLYDPETANTGIAPMKTIIVGAQLIF